jgi:hypothetical protein
MGAWTDARDPPARPHDHPAVDLLAQDGVRAAHVAASFRGYGGCFDPESELTKRLRSFQHHLVACPTALNEREVEIALFDLKPEHVWFEQAQRLEEELLPGLVAVKHGDGWCGHRPNHMESTHLSPALSPKGEREGKGPGLWAF